MLTNSETREVCDASTDLRNKFAVNNIITFGKDLNLYKVLEVSEHRMTLRPLVRGTIDMLERANKLIHDKERSDGEVDIEADDLIEFALDEISRLLPPFLS